jgi:hypothetical protein
MHMILVYDTTSIMLGGSSAGDGEPPRGSVVLAAAAGLHHNRVRSWRGGLPGPDLGPFWARFGPIAGGGDVVQWGSWCGGAAGRRSMGGSPAAIELEGQVWVFWPQP